MSPGRPRPARAPGDRRPARAREGLGGDQVEGRQAVLELLVARRRAVRRVLVADHQEPSEVLDRIEALARERRVPVVAVSRARLDREAHTEGHQGVLARCDPVRDVPLASLCEGSGDAFVLVCDGVSDPRNLGALLRSAECAGVSGVVLPTHRAARLTPTVAKTAAGAVEHLRFAAVGGIPSALSQLTDLGVRVVGLAPEAKASLYDLDCADGPVALVVGGEERGLGRLARQRCDEVVAIPQLGHIASLNASVAGSIACFEVARQRRLGQGRRRR